MIKFDSLYHASFCFNFFIVSYSLIMFTGILCGE